METSLMGKDMTRDDYQDYIDKIVNIFRISDSYSSILFDLKINNYQALAKMSIINREGQKEEFHDTLLECNQDFSSFFLIPLIQKICEVAEVETKDIVNLSDDELVTFRMITKHNDLFTVDGLSPDDANSLLSLSKQTNNIEKEVISNDNSGVGGVSSFLLLIGLITVAFIAMIMIIS